MMSINLIPEAIYVRKRKIMRGGQLLDGYQAGFNFGIGGWTSLYMEGCIVECQKTGKKYWPAVELPVVKEWETALGSAMRGGGGRMIRVGTKVRFTNAGSSKDGEIGTVERLENWSSSNPCYTVRMGSSEWLSFFEYELTPLDETATEGA